ncbi:hypothetical protein, variant 1 [Aphanomyces invadans]|uniref:Oxidation resistance protein 1 n=1 Tax=Aphanomyces invadans TaxID=157072 RepID=A0A024TBQ6_9STRA|nr:hypothetical protein, variant 1 [Aphanomyces invadans]ETV91463.1 hypothetical protein, variant 1 [Aphanomyces invadans]|eukprot:XP_008879915.1 hypothetical protein, variant 1 [Aphanomyces invadans]
MQNKQQSHDDVDWTPPALCTSQRSASLPPPAALGSIVESTTQGPQFKYVVKDGDTIAGIALRHGIREYDLRQLNHLFGCNIYKGQELVVRVKSRSNSVPTPAVVDGTGTNSSVNRRYSLSQARSGGSFGENPASPVPFSLSCQPSSNQQDDLSTAPAVVPSDNSKSNSNQQLNVAIKSVSSSATTPETDVEATNALADVASIPILLNATSMDILPDPSVGKFLVPKLEACLPPQYRGYDWSLAYSLAQHGASLDTLYRKLYHRRATLLVVETGDGDIFGAFASSPWAVSTSFYGTGECFVFTCYPKFEQFGWTGKNNMNMCSNETMLAMGGGGGFTFGLNADLSRGTSAPSLTFGNRCLTKRSEFDVVNCEVWEFVPKV